MRVESAHGFVLVRALITSRQRRDSVFIPMHWTGQYASRARVDALVAPMTDPESGQPASKNVPVSVRRFEAGQYGFAVMAQKPAGISADYWALAKTGNGWRMELALQSAHPDPASLARQLFSAPPDAELIAYMDQSTEQTRYAQFDGSKLTGALFLGPLPVGAARANIVQELGHAHENLRERFRVIAGRAGKNRPDPGPIVCSCFSVGVNDIRSFIASGARLTVEDVARETKAGSNCGSCRAEIRSMITLAASLENSLA